MIKVETHDAIREATAKANAAFNNHLEDIIAGLLINGVRLDEIQIHRYNAAGRTEVIVRGVPRYELSSTT